MAVAVALGVLVGCGSSASTGSSSPAPAPASTSSPSACKNLVSNVKDLAATVTSPDQTKQQKVDAAKSLGTQISADAKAASGAAKTKLTTLGDDVSALADDLKNGASADQIKQDLSKIASAATGAAAACLTQ